MLKRLFRILGLMRTSFSRPIFRRTKERCKGLHQWTTIDHLMDYDDTMRLKTLCDEEHIAPLVTLCHGGPICRECGYIASHDISVNIDNLILNLRALDT